jgi:streptomycin 6-kinase
MSIENELNQENIVRNNNSYYNTINQELGQYIDRWKLNSLEIVEDKKINCVLRCNSEIYGDAILKINKFSNIIADEYDFLKEYNGRNFCKVYDADKMKGVLIEEEIKPGTQLRKVHSLDERLTVFCSLHKGLHITPAKEERYRTYLDWVTRITKYMENRNDYKELYHHMKNAEEICKQLFIQYPIKMLLHGDLHHDNILLNSRNEYTIIDPKGIIGDPIFDIPRFLLNEMEDDINQNLYQKFEYMINVIGKQLDVPIKVLKQCFYVETAMAECWNVEDEDNVKIDNVIFAERLLNL